MKKYFQKSPNNVEVLPTDDGLHASHLQGLQSVRHSKAVLARVLADLLEILA